MKTKLRNYPISLFLALGALVFTGIASATEVTVSDPGSSFDLIYDSDALGLYGTPFLVDNVVYFTPTTFFAVSNDGVPPLGDGEEITNSTVTFRLVAKDPNVLLQTFNVQANGDYRLSGLGTSVDVDGQIRLFDPHDPFNQYTDQLTTSSDLTINDANTHDWVATAALGFGGASEVVVTLQNILTASSTLLTTSAFIEKKFEGVQITVNAVPLPAAAWLFGSGLLGLGGMRRRLSRKFRQPAAA